MPGTQVKRFVETVRERCRVCFTCVRECPSKAIRIRDGQAEVIAERCIGCGLCEASCPFSAIRLIKVHGKGYRAENISASCKGCGICAASCPQKTIDMKHFRDTQILAAIHAGGGN